MVVVLGMVFHPATMIVWVKHELEQIVQAFP